MPKRGSPWVFCGVTSSGGVCFGFFPSSSARSCGRRVAVSHLCAEGTEWQGSWCCRPPRSEGEPMATKTAARTMFATRNDMPEDDRVQLVELLNARLADTFDLYSQV